MNSDMITGLILIIAAIAVILAGQLLLFIWRRKLKKM